MGEPEAVMDPSGSYDGGYFLVWRRIAENPVWTSLEPGVLKVLLAFLIKANWKPKTWYDGRSQVEIPRGSFVTSYCKMAEFCQLSPKQARSAFAHLQNLRFAAYTRARKWTMVTVLNYDTYQASKDDEGTVKGGLRAGSGHDEGTMMATTEEGKKGKKGKREEEKPRASPDGNARGDGLTSDETLFPVETAPAAKPTPGMTQEQKRWFAEWWAEYWLHRAKKAARLAFGKQVKTVARFQKVMAATRAQKAEMLSREASKRPHGATWLNGERWEDETGDASPQQSAGGSTYTSWDPPPARPPAAREV